MSSATRSLVKGTLKSTRMNTRLSVRSRSRMESFATGPLFLAAGYNPFAASSLMRSTQRDEYAHSLSYHDRTLMKSPSITLV